MNYCRILLFSIILFGCGLPTSIGPFEPFKPLEPLPIYNQWWVEMEQCSKRIAPIADIKWYTFTKDTTVLGFYRFRDRSIRLHEAAVTNEWIVSHEMVHALVLSDHSHPAFEQCNK
jgi:hypothetical protein